MQGILRGNRDVGRIFELCDGLDDNNPDQRDAKKYLTQLLLIKACGAYEDEIGRIVYEKMKKSCDNEAAPFVSSSMLAYKHLSLDALKGNIVGRFGNERKRAFAGRIEGSSAVSAYNSIVNARNAVAHGRSATMTYSDLKRSLDDADRVLVELAAVLGSGGDMSN